MRRTKLFWIVLAVVVLAYVSAGLSRITFNIDILRLLPTHQRQVEGLSLFLKNFALPNELIVTIEAPDAETAAKAALVVANAAAMEAERVRQVTCPPANAKFSTANF